MVTVREQNRDPAVRNKKAVSDATFDSPVRQVYKVLLTRGIRGMRGTVLYATDEPTRRLLGDLVEGRQS